MATTRGRQRDFAALEARRMEAARLFARNVSQHRVARQLGVSVTPTCVTLRCTVPLAFGLFVLATSASAECAWVLWGNLVSGSDPRAPKGK